VSRAGNAPVDAEGVPPEQYKSYRRVRESLLALSDEKALEQAAICGDAEEVTDKIPQHQEALGVNYLMGSFNRGGVPHEQIMRSMRLFEEKVLPRLA
jgi:alkanesulfonate monooxygenase SsuD/methylene tetrahydromethanopterin reductase-like flavin-dependent oxidoreductase (luciferase family)